VCGSEPPFWYIYYEPLFWITYTIAWCTKPSVLFKTTWNVAFMVVVVLPWPFVQGLKHCHFKLVEISDAFSFCRRAFNWNWWCWHVLYKRLDLQTFKNVLMVMPQFKIHEMLLWDLLDQIIYKYFTYKRSDM
jgi:hypothetical protein